MITTEEELNIKMKFYAQYFGQTVVRSDFDKETKYLRLVNPNCFAFPHVIINSHLELKSSDKITNEDSISISKIMNSDHLITNPLEYCSFTNRSSIKVIDFLRSKGYAVPFMEYSIDDLIKMNFIKITQ